MTRNRGRVRRVLALAGLTAGLASAAARPAVAKDEAAALAPSELLSYVSGASAYTGVGRYEGRATCTAFFIDTGPLGDDKGLDPPAYAVTSGHCPGLLGPNEVFIDADGVGQVIFNFFFDSRRSEIRVPVARTAYATMKGRDLAVLELAVSYRELTGQLIRPWLIASSAARVSDPVEIVGAPLWLPDVAESFLRISRCRTEGVAPVVIEHVWHWFDAPFNRCRDVLPGSSGSPVISTIDRRVVGIVNTTTVGAAPLTDCARNSPCEPAGQGAVSRPDTTYATPLTGITACFDGAHRFNIHEDRCPLDPGAEVAATPDDVGPVNPLLETQPLGAVRRKWNISVVTVYPSYQYAMVSPPFDDCRTTPAYSAPAAATDPASIDLPLPVSEGFTFLCIVGAATREGDLDLEIRKHPAIVVARTDLTPPKLPAQVTILDRGDAWQVRFATVGQEIAFHAYKVGPRFNTRCDDPVGYEYADTTVVLLPKPARPYRLCAIPYDSAQNPGRLVEYELP